MITGAVGGVIVVFSVLFIDRIGIDDPVGAVSVHGVCGVWGTLAVGLFAKYDDAFLGVKMRACSTAVAPRSCSCSSSV